MSVGSSTSSAHALLTSLAKSPLVSTPQVVSTPQDIPKQERRPSCAFCTPCSHGNSPASSFGSMTSLAGSVNNLAGSSSRSGSFSSVDGGLPRRRSYASTPPEHQQDMHVEHLQALVIPKLQDQLSLLTRRVITPIALKGLTLDEKFAELVAIKNDLAVQIKLAQIEQYLKAAEARAPRRDSDTDMFVLEDVDTATPRSLSRNSASSISSGSSSTSDLIGVVTD